VGFYGRSHRRMWQLFYRDRWNICLTGPMWRSCPAIALIETEELNHDRKTARGGHRRWGIWRSFRRESAPEGPGKGPVDRSRESSSFPTAALSGRDFRPFAGSDRLAHSRYSAAAGKYDGDHG